jgi:hypothetical protein
MTAETKPDDDLFRAIGRFVFEFSQLEYSIKFFLHELMEVRNDLFDAFVGPIDFAAACSALKETCRVLKLQQVEQIISLINGAQKINEQRIKIVHGLWAPAAPAEKLVYISRTSLKASHHFPSPLELDKLSKECSQIKWGLNHEIYFVVIEPREDR